MKDLKIFTNNIEEVAKQQIDLLLEQEAFKDCKVRIMPDVHAGAGCVIGFTGNLGDKVIPNIVGVDIGCLDDETEFLTDKGWKRISDYQDGDNVLIYDLYTNKSFFEQPLRYIKEPCEDFILFKTKYGLNQCVTDEHKMLVHEGYKNKKSNLYFATHFYDKISQLVKSDFYHVKTTFDVSNIKGLTLSDDQLRLWIMISADGRIRYSKTLNHYYIECHFTKQRKINRCEKLLRQSNVQYNKSILKDSSVNITFTLDWNPKKDLTDLYMCSTEQAKVVFEEYLLWDGTIDNQRNHKSYSTTIKQNADVIQFICALNGVRAGIYKVNSGQNDTYKDCYNVYQTNNNFVSFGTTKPKRITKPNAFKYCFTTTTGYFIIRRNNCISITGNCGMLTVELGNVELDLEKLDKIINKCVPSGFNVHDERKVKFDKLQDLKCYRELKDIKRLERSIGTLGGGNHFIEVDVDDEGNKYLVIHTGSRNLGKQVAEYYQNLAVDLCSGKDKMMEEQKDIIKTYKEQGKKDEIQQALKELQERYSQLLPSLPKDLCYLKGRYREYYLNDMNICQEFAVRNRETIAKIILYGYGLNYLEEYKTFQTIHNYISFKDNIVRKGAISARKGEKVLIPINMRDGCIIGIGKGNDDWNQSAPHGAGRIMSRTKAKETFKLEDFKESMKDIYTTSVSENTLDEAPFVYKPMQEIIDNIGDTVEIIKIIKPIYNYKAN